MTVANTVVAHMPSSRYSRTAILLHWLAALLILFTFLIGIWMTNIPISPNRLKLFNWHKWAGICVLTLSMARLLWRLAVPPPPLPPMPRWQTAAAKVGHALLYLLCLVVPLSGWLYSSAAGFPVVLFGLLPLPDLVAVDPDVAQVLKAGHRIGTYGMAGLVVVHVAGVLEHELMRRDDLLDRIDPRHLWRRTA